MNIPEIVKQHVLKHNKRMPETKNEIDQYLDLINHAKEYSNSLFIAGCLSKRMMKKLGFKTSNEIKEEGKKLFNFSNL
jgi:hypothetical protein